MNQPAMDIRNLPDNLMSAGIAEPQARAIADAIADSRQGLATQADVKNLETRIINFETNTKSQFELVNTRLGNMEAKFDRTDGKFDTLEARFDRMDGKFDKLEAKFDKLQDDVTMLKDGFYQTRAAITVLDAKVDTVISQRTSERWIQGLMWVTALAVIGAMIQFLG